VRPDAVRDAEWDAIRGSNADRLAFGYGDELTDPDTNIIGNAVGDANPVFDDNDECDANRDAEPVPVAKRYWDVDAVPDAITVLVSHTVANAERVYQPHPDVHAFSEPDDDALFSPDDIEHALSDWLPAAARLRQHEWRRP
jgi:hypothetical protein